MSRTFGHSSLIAFISQGGPTAPASPAITALGGTGSVVVSGAAVPGATSYNLQWSTTQNGTYAAVSGGTGISPATFVAGFTDTNAAANANASTGLIWYPGQAVGAGGSSAYSTPAVSASPWIGFDPTIAANGTVVSTYTPPVGPAYSNAVFGSSFDSKIQSNMITGKNTAGGANTQNFSLSNLSYTCSFTYNSTDGATQPICLTGRLTNSTNYWQFGSFSGVWKLIDNVAGVQTVRGTSTQVLVNTTTYTMEWVFSNTTITCYINGVQVIQYSSATFNQSATVFGFILFAGGSQIPVSTLTNIKVTSP